MRLKEKINPRAIAGIVVECCCERQMSFVNTV